MSAPTHTHARTHTRTHARTHCTLDTLITEQYNPGEREGKHIIHTKRLHTRGQSFSHPTLAREGVFSTELMRGSAISEYVVSHTLGTYMLFLFSSSSLPPLLLSSSSLPHLFLFSSPSLPHSCNVSQHADSTHSIVVSQYTW